MERVELAIPVPEMFQGRPVTNRGVHLQDFGYHDVFMDNHEEWTNRLKAMSMSWVVACTEGDAFVKSDAAATYMEAGCIPILRFTPSGMPGVFTQMAAVEEYVALCAVYGIPPLIIYLNEPYDDREWKDGQKPDDLDEFWDVWTTCWRKGARIIIDLGGIVGIPDGPCFDRNPFPYLLGGFEDDFAQGRVFYAGHYYGLNRPGNYPFDDAQRLGTPLTQAEYLALLDDFADPETYPDWHIPPLDELNAEREAKKNANLRPDIPKAQGGDPVCFNGWMMAEKFMADCLGYYVPHAMTEGGYTPKAIAGTTPETFEKRYLKPTWHQVAARTVEMFGRPDVPMFALCPWLLASTYLGGGGWEEDAWFGGGGGWLLYGFKKPVATALEGGQQPPCDVEQALANAQQALGRASAASQAVTQALGNLGNC